MSTRPVRPVWRLPYTFQKQNLIEMLNEIMAGTFRTNTETPFTRNQNFLREVLIQCRERELCSFTAEDCNAHLVPAEGITIIPQPEIQRGKH